MEIFFGSIKPDIVDIGSYACGLKEACGENFPIQSFGLFLTFGYRNQLLRTLQDVHDAFIVQILNGHYVLHGPLTRGVF